MSYQDFSGYKNYFQRLLESQTVYKGTRQASPSIPGYEDGPNSNRNLGSRPGGEGTLATTAGTPVFDSIEEMMTTTDPDPLRVAVRDAQVWGPRLNKRIQDADSKFRSLYWETQRRVAGDPVLESKLQSFVKAQKKLYIRWMRALHGFTTYLDDMEILAYQFESLLSELVKFNALVR